MPEQRQGRDDAVCMIAGCDRPVRSRGCCNPCYITLYKRVEAGETTWEELEQAGLVLPPHTTRRGPRNPATVALEGLKDQGPMEPRS